MATKLSTITSRSAPHLSESSYWDANERMMDLFARDIETGEESLLEKVKALKTRKG